MVGAVLLAAVLHASWNATAHAIADRFVGFALMGIAVTVGGAALVLAAPGPATSSWAFLGGSVVLHIGYNAFLLRSYRLGHFGQVYPIARGTSPLLVALTAFVFAGEQLSAPTLAGVLVISAGLLVLVTAGGLPTAEDWPAIVSAVTTGLFIAAFTTVDGLGVRRSGTSLGYAAWLFLFQGPAIPLAALGLRGRALAQQLRPHLAAGLVAGGLSIAAYGLVLWAQTRGALAPIAALRETGVILGAVIAAVRFREPFGRSRIAAACLVAGGIVLISA